jgi:hypothetical protein
MRTKKKLYGAAALVAAAGALLAAGCRSTYDRRDPTGETFPSVGGSALDGRDVRLPEAFAGSPVVLLIGYEQNTQFDLDRWAMGMRQAGVTVAACEVPTIPGLVPGLFSGYIDGGMRRGIPQEDWGSVVTVYGDGDLIARFTGNADGLPGRIVLLDKDGRVVFFHDRGFSPGTLDRLRAAIDSLR